MEKVVDPGFGLYSKCSGLEFFTSNENVLGMRRTFTLIFSFFGVLKLLHLSQTDKIWN